LEKWPKKQKNYFHQTPLFETLPVEVDPGLFALSMSVLLDEGAGHPVGVADLTAGVTESAATGAGHPVGVADLTAGVTESAATGAGHPVGVAELAAGVTESAATGAGLLFVTTKLFFFPVLSDCSHQGTSDKELPVGGLFLP
jgi:hypothetical protein